MKDGIVVQVQAQYLKDQSRPAANQFVYAYSIRISNKGDTPAQLISRHWRIINANNEVREVQGLGVVGEQPRLEPGQSYSYTSGVVMETGTGTMSGSYTFRHDSGAEFETEIPTFALVQPSALH